MGLDGFDFSPYTAEMLSHICIPLLNSFLAMFLQVTLLPTLRLEVIAMIAI